MDFRTPFAPALEYFRRHISQEAVSNERLGLLFGGAVVLFILTLLYGFWSATSRMADQLAASKTNLARLQVEATGDEWPRRLEVTQALKTQLSVRLWDAATPGLAEAGFETWLRTRFSRHGGTLQQILITRSPAVGRDGQTTPSLEGLQRMTAKVLAPFDQAVMTQVLADAAEADRMILIDRLIVRGGANSRLEMDISTFIRTGETVDTQAKP